MKPWKAFLIVVFIMIIFGALCVYYLAEQGFLAGLDNSRFGTVVARAAYNEGQNDLFQKKLRLVGHHAGVVVKTFR